PHCAEILLAQARIDRGAGQLAIGKFQTKGVRLDDHLAQEVGSDLVTQSPGTAVNAEDNVSNTESERSSGRIIENFCDFLNFEVMIAGAERSHLVLLAVHRQSGNVLGKSAGHTSVFLDAIEICRKTVA